MPAGLARSSLRPIFLPGDGGATRIAVELYLALPSKVSSTILKLHEYTDLLRSEGLVTSNPALVMQSFTDARYLPVVFEWVSSAAPNAADVNPAVQGVRAELDAISDLETIASFVDYQERFPPFKPRPVGGRSVPASSTWGVVISAAMMIALVAVLLRRRVSSAARI